MKPYDPKKIEKKWQAAWQKSGIYKAVDTNKKKKFYSLIEFPYPSGEGLHVGHVRSNTAMDIVSRKRRMEGYNVLYPIGWDAFGLPTENYAIKTGTPPAVVTKRNSGIFRRQLKALGFSFDWTREVNTSDPGYYKWTQWIFLEMWKRGLAYKKKTLINWCPKDKIGLANEEVVDGCCERCGTPVEKREKEQWMLAITKYADRLDRDLDSVDYLPEIKTQQRNWIGRSEGAEIEFKIKDKSLKVFTTRPDTLFGVTYLALAPEHPLVAHFIHQASNADEIKTYITSSLKKTEIERTDIKKEKTGIPLKGVMAINPVNNEELPIWIADYVLSDYGTGAVMAVPAHDERDWEFATRYHLPIKEVIVPNIIDERNPPKAGKKFVERKNIHAIVKDPKTGKYLGLKWKKFNWLTFPMGGVDEGEDVVTAAKREVQEETGFTNLKLVKVLDGQARAEYFAAHKDQNRISFTTAVLFDLIDHTQLPLSEEDNGRYDIVWLHSSELNYEHMTHAEIGMWMEKMKAKNPAYTGSGILINSANFTGMSSNEATDAIAKKFGKIVTTYKLRDWVFSRQRYWGEPIPLVWCEKCGWQAVPEKELPVKLPPVKKYTPTDTGESLLAGNDPAIKKWRTTKCPHCGGVATRETDTMPNWAGSSWYFLRYTDPHNKKTLADAKKLKHWQPVDWYNGGMEHTTLHLLYSRFWNKFLFDIGVAPTTEPYAKRTAHGMILAADGEKMSKSRGNVINPDQIVATHGADTLRLYEMFMGPFNQSVSWSTDGIVGPRRFLERAWRLTDKITKSKTANNTLENLTHKTIKKVSSDIEAMQFNTAISAMMILVNEMERAEKIPAALYEIFLRLLAPFAPHVSEELWHQLGHKKSIHLELWPMYDESKIRQETLTIVVQVNGKVRGQLSAASEITEAEATRSAQSLESIKKWLTDKAIDKIIYVPGRLINIVTRET